MARHHHLLSSLPALLLPLGLFSAPAAQAGGSYQRSYASARRETADSSAFDPWVRNRAAIRLPQAAAHAEDLVITAAQGVRELVVIDSAVPDKAVFYRGMKPGVDVVEIDASRPGLEQLKQALAPYRGLAALHIVSHAEDGVLHLGSSRVDAQALKQDMDIFASLNGALADGADLLLYGCDLAHGDKGEELLEVIRSNTHLDIAASTNKTGNVEQGGDWELEIQRGEITSALAFSEKSLRDFSAVLAPTTYNSLSFCWGPAAPGYGAGGNGDMCAGPLTSQDGNMVISAAPTAVLAAGPNWGGYSLITQDSSIGVTSGWLQFSADGTNLSAFKLSSVTRGYTWGYSCQSITVTGTRQSDATSVSDSLSGAAVPYGNDAVHTPINLADVALTSVRVQFDNCTQHMGFFSLRSFTIEPATTNNAPVNDVPPAITGAATVGNALNGSTGSWTDADGDTLSYTYQWYRADDNSGTNVVAIAAATNPNYTLTTSDAHRYVRIVVTANDGSGGVRSANSAYTQVINSAPVNSVAPTISGIATVGNALTTTNGTWSDADGDSRTFTYQWYRADDNSGTNLASIAGANSASYTLTSSDAHKYLRVVVTANDGNGGATPANSAYTQVTNSAPVNNVAPAVSGTATVGNALSTTNGTWSDADGDGRTFSYQWYRADSNGGTNLALIGGATSANYTLTTADAHKYLRVVVTANDGNGGITPANSAYTQVSNSAPVNSVAPTISGTATVGNALTTTNGTWSDADGDSRTYTYQWYRADDNSGTNLAAIGGATNASYTLTTGDARKYLRVVVTANDGNGGTTPANSAYTQVSNSAPANTVAPAVSGTAAVGNALSTTIGTWTDADGDGLTYTYQWYRADDNSGTNLAAIGGATNASYTLTLGDASKYVRVVVTASDGQGGTQAANSIYTQVASVLPGAPTGVAATAAPGQAEISFTAPVTTGGSEITRYTATATPGGQSGYCDIAPGSPAGSVCSVTVTGLTNGTSYTFTVKATNTNGVGADSAASNTVVPRLLQVDATPGAVPGMAGVATATLSGGGATCTLQPGGGGGFGPASQVPPGFQAPHGQFAFAAVQCAGTVTLTLQYPQPLPASIRFRKPDGAGGWFDPQDAATPLNVTVSPDRRTVTYDITDDGLGDTERTTPGAISDPFVPVLLAAPASGVQGIPTLGTWGLTLLSALAGLLGMRQVRRRLDESK